MSSRGRQRGTQTTALELFGGLAASYERALDVATLAQDRYWKRKVTELAGLRRGEAVLDIGSGTLLLEERLSESGAEFVGVDLAEAMIRVGQAKRLDGVSLVNGDAEGLPFRDATFDVVVSCYVPKYVDLQRFVAELARVVRPGGRAVLYDFVAPEGGLSLLLEAYLQGVIRIAGFLLTLARSPAAFTFRNLPEIVRGAKWAEGFPGLMAVSFEEVEFRRLTGGVVCIYAGVRRHPAADSGRA